MSRSSSISALYARIPYGVVRKQLREGVMHLNIPTPALRRLLADKSVSRDIKGRLWAFAQYRRRIARWRRHGHA